MKYQGLRCTQSSQQIMTQTVQNGLRSAFFTLMIGVIPLVVSVSSIEGRIGSQSYAQPTPHHSETSRVMSKGSELIEVLVAVRIPWVEEMSVLKHQPHIRLSAEKVSTLQDQLLTDLERAQADQPLQFHIKHRYRWAPVLLLNVDSAAHKLLSAHPQVSAIHANHISAMVTSSSIPYIGADRVHGLFDGSGRAIAIIDSPVNTGHPDFGACADLSAPECRVKQVLNFVDEPIENINPTHGTNVAAIALAVAPASDLYSLNTFRNTPDGLRSFDSDILEAIDWVIEQKTQNNIPFTSINMSLGGGAYDPPCYNNSYTSFFSQLYSIGILPVVATGNDANPTHISWPACTPGSVMVGALLDNNYRFNFGSCSQQGAAGDVACFTNKNGLIDMMAPGVSLTGGGYSLSGTSMATPHVAGSIALIDHIFEGELSALNMLNILKFWSIPEPQDNDRIYSSLNFSGNKLSFFQFAATTNIAFNPLAERLISNTGTEHNFQVNDAHDFRVGKVYALIRADHPDPRQLEVYITAPNGQRAGGPLGESVVADGSNLNAVLGHDVSKNLFRALTGVNSVGTWRLEVHDPQERRGYLLSGALFLAQIGEVKDPHITCSPCGAPTDCANSGYACHVWDERPDQGFCVATCASNEACDVGFTCSAGRCLPELHRQCKEDAVWLYDTCGQELGQETACTESCSQGNCVGGCTADTYRNCVNNAVYAYDSCGVQGELIDQCGDNERCEVNGDTAVCNCTPETSRTCVNGDVYLVNSCGEVVELAQDCVEGERCEVDRCVDIGCAPDESENNDTRQTAHPVSISELISQLNFCVDDHDYYEIELLDGRAYDFETYTYNQADTQITIYSPEGSRLRSDDDGGDGQGSLVSNLTPTNSGAYIIEVASQNGQVGPGHDYELLVRPQCNPDEFEHNDRPETSRLLSPSTQAISLTLCDIDWFMFNANAGEQFVLETGLPEGGDTTLVLLDSNLQLIEFNDDRNGLASRIDFTAHNSGIHYLVVGAFAQTYESNPYTLRVQKNSEEVCDGVDNDLDGSVDEGLTPPLANKRHGPCEGARQVCAGERGWVEPDYQLIEGYEEVEVSCDGIDNDCDGQFDRNLTPPPASAQSGVCGGSLQVCGGVRGWLDPDYTLIPSYEPDEAICDGLDNDCDGQTDESLPSTPADNQSGVCAGALQICAGVRGWIEPDYAQQAHFEHLEVSCDGLDNDCDGRVDEALFPPLAARRSGVCAGSFKACAGVRGWVEPYYPSLPNYEVQELSCDGLDNDCDDQIDESLNAPLASSQEGVCSGARQVCQGVLGWVEPEYSTITGYEEVEVTCDGVDNDCDLEVDESLDPPQARLQDGVCSGASQVCDGDHGWVEPLYTLISDYELDELSCDGLDNDCDRKVDESLDAPIGSSQDGVCAGLRQICEDASGWVEPDLSRADGYEIDEVSCDGRDNDCDGQLDEALIPPPAFRQSGVCEGAQQICGGINGWVEPAYTLIHAYEVDEQRCDGVDNDCDGITDEALVGELATEQRGVCLGSRRTCVGIGGWIDPHPSTINRYESNEVSCDGVDNDCDGAIDEGVVAPLSTRQSGVCADARQVCTGVGGWTDPDYNGTSEGYEREELSCDGLDNDCDGQVDESLSGSGSAPFATQQSGVCAGARQLCFGAAGWADPGYQVLTNYEEIEVGCDGLDNDCDGRTDESLTAPLMDEQRGVCEGAVQVCAGPGGWMNPLPEEIEGYEISEVSCDGLDNDCDGVVDESERCHEASGGEVVEAGETAGEFAGELAGESAGQPMNAGDDVNDTEDEGGDVVMVSGTDTAPSLSEAGETSGGGDRESSSKYGCAQGQRSSSSPLGLGLIFIALWLSRRRFNLS